MYSKKKRSGEILVPSSIFGPGIISMRSVVTARAICQSDRELVTFNLKQTRPSIITGIHVTLAVSRNSNGTSKLPIVQPILPCKISFICNSSDIPLLFLYKKVLQDRW